MGDFPLPCLIRGFMEGARGFVSDDDDDHDDDDDDDDEEEEEGNSRQPLE